MKINGEDFKEVLVQHNLSWTGDTFIITIVDEGKPIPEGLVSYEFTFKGEPHIGRCWCGVTGEMEWEGQACKTVLFDIFRTEEEHNE